MGRRPARGAQEEGVPLEEEAQADGREGAGGRQLAVQVPRVWSDEADAPPLPAVHAEYVMTVRQQVMGLLC